MKLTLLVGTTTGTALSVAQAIQMDCQDASLGVSVRMMDDVTLDIFNPAHAAETLDIVCLSTHGAGEVPDSAQALFQALADEPQFLGHVHYGLVALGDSAGHGETYCFGAHQFDDRLQDLGAQRLGDICYLDAVSEALPETTAVEWSRQWLATAKQPAAGG